MELNRQLRRRVTGLCGEFLMALAMAGIGSPLQAAPLALYPGMGGVPDMGAIHCRTFNEMYPAGPNGLRQAILYWTGDTFMHKPARRLMKFLRRQAWARGTLKRLPTISLSSARRNPMRQCPLR